MLLFKAKTVQMLSHFSAYLCKVTNLKSRIDINNMKITASEIVTST